MPTTDLDTAIRTHTAFQSLAHLRAHHAATGWAPSFRFGTEGALLAGVLLAVGIVCRLYI